MPSYIHDLTVAEWGGIYEKLRVIFERIGGRVTVDSAFSKEKCNFLIKSSQELPENPDKIIVNEEVISIRQLAKWGMRAFQSSFPRINDRLSYKETEERKLIYNPFVNQET